MWCVASLPYLLHFGQLLQHQGFHHELQRREENIMTSLSLSPSLSLSLSLSLFLPYQQLL